MYTATRALLRLVLTCRVTLILFSKSIFILTLFLNFFSCAGKKTANPNFVQPAGNQQQVNDGYPDAWWKSVPLEDIKGWEIPPQAANRLNGEVVLSKRTELGVFSNLSDSEFVLDGVKYASVEGLWQGMKYPENPSDERLQDPSIVWPYTREQVYLLTGFEAKKAGDAANANMKKMGIKWITYKGEKIEYNAESGKAKHYDIIYRASREKVMQNKVIYNLLLQTGSLKFLSDHQQQPNPSPAYLYFDIYMKIRAEIKKQEK